METDWGPVWVTQVQTELGSAPGLAKSFFSHCGSGEESASLLWRGAEHPRAGWDRCELHITAFC